METFFLTNLLATKPNTTKANNTATKWQKKTNEKANLNLKQT